MPDRFKEPYSHPRWWWVNDYVPSCFNCAHFEGMIKGKPRCAAFPDGIPKDIILSKEPAHQTPYPGDHGLIFEEFKG